MNLSYLSEKQFRKRKFVFKLKIYSGLFIFSILIIGVLYFIIYSSILKVVKIEIVSNAGGAELEQNNKIINDFKIFLANRSKLTLILGSDNIISWMGNFNIKKFLNENPLIDDLQIKKDYLLRQIIFEIKKREKFGIWCQQAQIGGDDEQINVNISVNSRENQHESATKCWWFDKNGKIFEKAPKIEGEMIYKVNDFSNRQLAIGSQIIEKNLFDNLLEIFNVIEQAGLNIRTVNLKDPALQEIFIEPPRTQSPKIYFSLRIDPSFVLSAIQKLRNEGIFKKVEYIDFRVENRVYYNL